ncbi:hypothetical protein N136_02508, partial [Leifsonia aquatica ATCC 14665]
MVENENIDSNGNDTETGGRKRKGLFGARRAVKRTTDSPVQQAGATAAPEAQASAGDTADGAGQAVAAE